MRCPRKKPSSSSSEDEEQVEQESSCLNCPSWRVRDGVLEGPRPSLSVSPFQSRASSRGRSRRELRERLSDPGRRAESEGMRQRFAPRLRFRCWYEEPSLERKGLKKSNWAFCNLT